MENAQIELIATEEGVVSANINWFQWIKAGKRINITTPVVALLKAYEKRGQEEQDKNSIVIKEIRQGYYFNTNMQNDIASSVALEGTVPPMWVIVSDKNEIYINAYNEKQERIK